MSKFAGQQNKKRDLAALSPHNLKTEVSQSENYNTGEVPDIDRDS